MNIAWLDGNNSDGQFVLEMFFEDGGKGYLKGDYNQISGHYDLFWKSDDVVGMTIYDPSWKVVATKARASAFAMAG